MEVPSDSIKRVTVISWSETSLNHTSAVTGEATALQLKSRKSRR